jgi:hypothetical protein
MQTENWHSLSTEAQNEIMEGALAYHALKHEHHDYNHWVKVGKAIVQLRRAAAMQAGVSPNSLKHPAYRAAYKRLINSEKAGELGEIDTGTQTHAAWLANHFLNVESWRRTLTDKERISLNHPTAIWRKHPDGRKAERFEQQISGQAPARKSVTRELNTVADRLNDATDRIESKVSGVELFDMSPALIGSSARNFVEIFGADDTRRFIAELQAILEPAAEPEPPLDTAFTESVKKPRRPKAHRGKRASEAKPPRPSRAQPTAPVVPAWCKPGKLQVRAALLLEAITAAGPAGLHVYDDIQPLDMSEAARARGIAARVELTVTVPEEKAPVIEVGERAYLRRFAPGAAGEAATEAPGATSPPGEQEQAELPESARVALAKMRTVESATAAELYAELGVSEITLDALVMQGRLVQDVGRRYRLAPERGATRVPAGWIASFSWRR